MNKSLSLTKSSLNMANVDRRFLSIISHNFKYCLQCAFLVFGFPLFPLDTVTQYGNCDPFGKCPKELGHESPPPPSSPPPLLGYYSITVIYPAKPIQHHGGKHCEEKPSADEFLSVRNLYQLHRLFPVNLFWMVSQLALMLRLKRGTKTCNLFCNISATRLLSPNKRCVISLISNSCCNNQNAASCGVKPYKGLTALDAK